MDLQPIEIAPEQLEAVRNPKCSEYLRNNMLIKLYGVCCTCGSISTHILSYNVGGATRQERYCNNCIKENKHTQQSELKQKFESLIIKAEYGNPDYDLLHAPKAKNIGPDYYRIHRRHGFKKL